MRADTLQLATGLLKNFEGFSSKSYWDRTAERIGYGSDTITLADGRVIRVKKGMRVTKEDAARDLQRRLPEFERGIINTVGQKAWDALPSNSQAALLSVAYNYGSIGKLKSVKRAAQAGDIGALSNAVRALQVYNDGINKKRRNKEADFILGKSSVPISTQQDYAAQAQTQNTQQPFTLQDILSSMTQQQPQQQPQVGGLFGNLGTLNGLFGGANQQNLFAMQQPQQQSTLTMNDIFNAIAQQQQPQQQSSSGLASLFELKDF